MGRDPNASRTSGYFLNFSFFGAVEGFTASPPATAPFTGVNTALSLTGFFRFAPVRFSLTLVVAAALSVCETFFTPLPLSVSLPAAGTRTVTRAARPLTFAATIFTVHPATGIVELTDVVLPF